MKVPYVKTQLSTIVNISKIVTIHYYEFDKNFNFEGERHDFWELVYIDKGQVEIHRDDEKIVLSQGEIVFHRPNEFHSIRALNSAPNFFVISFVCSSSAMLYFEKFHTVLDKHLKPFLSSIISESEKTFEIPKNDPLLKRLIKKSPASIGGEQLIKTYLEQLLIFLIRNMTEKKVTSIFPSKESMENYLVSSIKSFIEEKTSDIFRINDLCEQIGYSKSFLCKLFHEQTGETIAAYAVKVKIKAAKRLIREGNLNFAQISDALSFDNPQYFCRVFKRVTGMTPTEFKLSLHFQD
ncbi:MAG: AraC family transcriptional regulator [Clostridiales bacterium]|nr:AraC family transcriptional regulator [Clostridiales bacterium]